MNHLRGIIPSLLIAVVFILGCSGSLAAIVPADGTVAGSVSSESHNMLGYYTFVCDPCKNLVHIIPQREISLHLNALKFLEPPPLLYLTMEGPPEFNGNILDIDIGLRNPYLGMQQFTGFDVCGIFISHGSLTGFHDDDLVMAGEGDTRLLNPDGYTRWWNPAEFPYDGTIFGYKDGLLGTPADVADFNCTLNGYKYFTDGLDPDEPLTGLATSYRGMFSAGQKNVRHYTIDISGGLIFNYAVDACWAQPQGGPPYSVPDDFPPIANRPEAYNIVITKLENTLYYDESTGYSGGKLKLLIDVRDHFNAADNIVFGESNIGLPFKEATQLDGGDDYCIYEIKFSGIGLAVNGKADLLITVQSEATGYGGLLPDEPVCAYFIYTFDISPEGFLGWARTWGSDFIGTGFPSYFSGKDERGSGVVTDSYGDIYSSGYFGSIVDFDPGPAQDMRESNGGFDVFLVKYDPYGHLTWIHTWGGDGHDRSRGIHVDDSDNVYVTGDFIGTVDFDPGPDIEQYQSHNPTKSDAYLSKFDKHGIHQWTLTWGGTGATTPYNVNEDNLGNLFVCGEYMGNTDFDPGPGIDNHPGNSNTFDAFIMKLDVSGNFIWAKTWGSSGRLGVVDIDFDSSNNLYCDGSFDGSVDFDPGSGVEILSGHGYSDAFTSKFDQDGNFLWVRSWGANYGYDQANGMEVIGADEIFITGRFVGTVDFDTTDGIENYTANGGADVFLTKFDSDGNWLWARTWGGVGVDVGSDVATDNIGNLLITGDFSETVDFDPGNGIVELTSSGGRDSFLSKLTTEGDLIWALTWGGEYSGGTFGDRAVSVTADVSGNIYVTGSFEETCDFFPGPGIDEHTSNGGTDIFLAKFPPDGNW